MKWQTSSLVGQSASLLQCNMQAYFYKDILFWSYKLEINLSIVSKKLGFTLDQCSVQFLYYFSIIISSLSLLIFLVFSLCLKDHIINWLLTIKDRRPFFDLYRSRKSKQFVIITISTLLTHITQINRIFLNIYVLHIYTIHIYCMILLCLLHEYIM